MTRTSLAFITAALLLETGCATVLKGSTSAMAIEGLPADASVETVDGLAVERSPPRTKHAGPSNEVLLPANDPPRALVVKANGKEAKLPARRFVGGGWIVLDIVFGFVPLIIDAATGAWHEYDDTKLPQHVRTAGNKPRARD